MSWVQAVDVLTCVPVSPPFVSLNTSFVRILVSSFLDPRVPWQLYTQKKKTFFSYFSLFSYFCLFPVTVIKYPSFVPFQWSSDLFKFEEKNIFQSKMTKQHQRVKSPLHQNFWWFWNFLILECSRRDGKRNPYESTEVNWRDKISLQDEHI